MASRHCPSSSGVQDKTSVQVNTLDVSWNASPGLSATDGENAIALLSSPQCQRITRRMSCHE
eukprot:scaffold251203_cov19-Prasinocladus_malaysianus.AAC.1